MRKRAATTVGPSFNDALREAIEMAARVFARGTLSGTATGLTDLDRLMGGLQRSDLVILAARPAMGKTSLATNIAFHVPRTGGRDHARRDRKTVDGGQVGFFSLEMSAEQLATRILAEPPRSRHRTSAAATSMKASSPSWSIRRI